MKLETLIFMPVLAAGGLKSIPVERIKKCEKFDEILPAGDWEMIVGLMVWTEGPEWWNDQLVFSDTRLGKIFSWHPVTRKVGIVLENSGYSRGATVETGIWLEPGSNGLKYNPITEELLICQHGNRAISALNKAGNLRRIISNGPNGNPLNSPNDVVVHEKTGDIYFTDPIFGKMTYNANIWLGNMVDVPEQDKPGFSGVYKVDGRSGKVTLINKEMKQPNGIGITSDNKLIVAHCNETKWEWWTWKLHEDGSQGPMEVLIDGSDALSGQVNTIVIYMCNFQNY